MSKNNKPKFQKMNFKIGFSGNVDRENGILYGYSVIQKGEALGHGLYVDDDFLDSVVEHGNKLSNGLKSRFTHPGMCSDGLGSKLGKSTNFRREGDKVKADLKFSKSAYKTPRGDLATYSMDLAEESPEDFGASIVFARDIEGEEKFRGLNTKNGSFKSPDKENKGNLIHARLAELSASDLVDEPAANRDGLFSADDVFSQAEAILDAVFEDESDSVLMGYHSSRIKSFFNDYIFRKGITFRKGEEMSDEAIDHKDPAVSSSTNDEVVVTSEFSSDVKTYQNGVEDEKKRCLGIVKKAIEFGSLDKVVDFIEKSFSVVDAIDQLKDSRIAELNKKLSTKVEPDEGNVPLSDEERFNSDKGIQREYGSLEAYLAFKKHESRVQIKGGN